MFVSRHNTIAFPNISICRNWIAALFSFNMLAFTLNKNNIQFWLDWAEQSFEKCKFERVAFYLKVKSKLFVSNILKLILCLNARKAFFLAQFVFQMDVINRQNFPCMYALNFPRSIDVYADECGSNTANCDSYSFVTTWKWVSKC